MWDEFCTVYVADSDRPRMVEAVREQISDEQIQRCRPIHVYVVEFTD